MSANDIDLERTLIERELISLLFRKNELINFLQIKPNYLYSKTNSKILETMIRSYKDTKVVDIAYMVGITPSFPIEEYIDIITNDMYYLNDWERQFKLSQDIILKKFKIDYIKELDKKLSENNISYEDFENKVKKMSLINISDTQNNKIKTINDIDLTYEEKTFIRSGCNDLDNSIKGFILGELSVWSGSNASAKSTYLNQIALESISQNYKVLIFSGELTDKRLINWIVLNACGKNNLVYNSEKNYFYVPNVHKQKIYKWLNDKLFVYDNSYGNDAKEILQSIESCVLRNDIKVVILDNLMSMNLAQYGEQKYDIQTKFMTELSEMAKRLNIHIHFVCHPRKSTAFLRKIDISGSSDLTNIADNVFIMHRVNRDFERQTKEMFKWHDDNPIYQYSNVIEICKNREYGVQDAFAGLYFEIESKRLLNKKGEIKKYGWEYLE